MESIGQGIIYKQFDGYFWCHSFPSHLSDVDICIGYNEDRSKPCKETIETAVNIFEDAGYKVGINHPYSNSETPDCPFHYKSMMIEVNKKPIFVAIPSA